MNITFLQNYLSEFKSIVLTVDVILVFLLFYMLLRWIKDTHSLALIRGIFWVLLIYMLSSLLGLSTLNWVLGKFTTVLLLLVIIIFQPELRRFLERIGTPGHLFSPLLEQSEGQYTTVIKSLLRAVELLSKEKVGALVVIEVSTNLSEYIESGIRINGSISPELLATLFWPNSPTHDGAVIIRENRIEAAGCLLPLTDTPVRDRRLGTRHRAALGLTELSDALVIVISEETGVISLAEHGNLTRFLSKEALETRLFNLYKEDSSASFMTQFLQGRKK